MDVDVDHSKAFVSPIHEAARCRNVLELQKLLSADAQSAKTVDSRGNTPLHSLLSEACPGDTCRYNAALCTKLLVDHGADINSTNAENEVPLFIAVRNNWPECAMILLDNGADTTIKVLNETKTLGLFVAENLENALTEVLDNAVTRGTTQLSNNNAEKPATLALGSYAVEIGPTPTQSQAQELKKDVLLVDFNCLLQIPEGTTGSVDETEFLHSLVHISKRTRIFQHPVTELFLLLKYHKLKPIIWSSIALHIFALIFYTVFIVGTYIHHCPYDGKRKNINESCKPENSRIIENNSYFNIEIAEALLNECGRCKTIPYLRNMGYVLWGIWAIIFVSEVSVFRYRSFRDTINVKALLSLSFYISMPITLWTIFEDHYYIETWRYPVAGLSIWLLWSLLIFQLEKIPQLSEYLVMFKKVSITVMLLACLFLPLLIGFLLGFYVIGANNIESEYSLVNLISVIVGGADYNDFFDKEENREADFVYKAVAILIYVLFIVLMCIVFINYLLGLTISDVNELWAEAAFISKKDQIQQIYLYDRIPYIKIHLFNKPQNNESRKYVVTVPIKDPPSHIPRELIRSLKQLCDQDCSHNSTAAPSFETKFRKLQKYNSTEISGNEPSSENLKQGTPGSDRVDNSQLLGAIKALENQLTIQMRMIRELERGNNTG